MVEREVGEGGEAGTAFNWESVRGCARLVVLDVSYSFMAGGRLPPALAALTRLHTLKANECGLQELGVQLPSLRTLELDGNQLRYGTLGTASWNFMFLTFGLVLWRKVVLETFFFFLSSV